MEDCVDYSRLRGFNYQPSYSSHLQYTWTNFDEEAWRREVPYALRFGSNMLRIWLDWSAYLAVGEQMLDNVEHALTILDASGLKMMPVLFNRWWDARYPAGGVSPDDLLRPPIYDLRKFAPYVDGLMDRFAQDERVAMWDLCNEPDAPYARPEVNFVESVWLAWAADRVRGKSAIPITIGTATYDFVRVYAALADVISFHPYAKNTAEMDKMCDDHLAMAAEFGKPLICTETCIGSLDDQERGQIAKECIESLEAHGIGWIAWQMCEGRFVTGSRERTDSNAIRPGEGYMPFVLSDGTTRPGHEWLERTRRG
jgi:hypothetical protein